MIKVRLFSRQKSTAARTTTYYNNHEHVYPSLVNHPDKKMDSLTPSPMKCKEQMALFTVAFQPRGCLHLSSHNFLLLISFLALRNFAHPWTASLQVDFLFLFLSLTVISHI